MNNRLILAYSNHETDPVAHHAVRRTLPFPRELHECKGDTGYSRLFKQLWLEKKPFILVEHDILVAQHQLEELDACPEPWCTFGYGPTDHLPEDGHLFGCVKFRPSGKLPFEGDLHYEAVADTVGQELLKRGWTVHQHYPHVVHLAPWEGQLLDEHPVAPDHLTLLPPDEGGFGRGRERRS